MEGRVEGAMSADGKHYEVRCRGAILKAIPIADARADLKLARTIKQNGWGPLA